MIMVCLDKQSLLKNPREERRGGQARDFPRLADMEFVLVSEIQAYFEQGCSLMRSTLSISANFGLFEQCCDLPRRPIQHFRGKAFCMRKLRLVGIRVALGIPKERDVRWRATLQNFGTS